MRADKGLAALVVDPELVEMARERSPTIANTDCFSHTSCGPTAFALLRGIGHSYWKAGEHIIARNNYPDSETVQVAMAGFINSPGHLANMLDLSYTKIGIGLAFDANARYYFTVVLSAP